MSGRQRLSHEAYPTPSFVTHRFSDVNFGLIAAALLTTLAIALAVIFPDKTLHTLEFSPLALSP
jgi:hypothetical protein